MERRHMLKTLSAWLAGAALPASSALAAPPFPLKKTEAEWRAIVSPAAYRVLFDHGTGDTTSAINQAAVVEFSDITDTDFYCSLELRFIEI